MPYADNYNSAMHAEDPADVIAAAEDLETHVNILRRLGEHYLRAAKEAQEAYQDAKGVFEDAGYEISTDDWPLNHPDDLVGCGEEMVWDYSKKTEAA